MYKSRIATTTASLAVLAMAASPAMAKKANQLTDLNGESAASAERHLEARGFKYIDGRKGGYDASYSYWWDKDDDDCVVVEVMDGRVMTINDAKDSDCGHSGSDAGTAVAVVAGAALIGALLAHKSDHHDEKEHFDNHEDERQYDRGFNDGLHNKSYHNYDSSQFYSRGYSKGVEQRGHNTSDHHGYGGYTREAKFKDLEGARAAGAMSAMSDRGFRQVDNFTSGNTRYSIQWRSGSKQCVQMTIADGEIYDIRDIGSHPKCR